MKISVVVHPVTKKRSRLEKKVQGRVSEWFDPEFNKQLFSYVRDADHHVFVLHGPDLGSEKDLRRSAKNFWEGKKGLGKRVTVVETKSGTLGPEAEREVAEKIAELAEGGEDLDVHFLGGYYTPLGGCGNHAMVSLIKILKKVFGKTSPNIRFVLRRNLSNFSRLMSEESLNNYLKGVRAYSRERLRLEYPDLSEFFENIRHEFE